MTQTIPLNFFDFHLSFIGVHFIFKLIRRTRILFGTGTRSAFSNSRLRSKLKRAFFHRFVKGHVTTQVENLKSKDMHYKTTKQSKKLNVPSIKRESAKNELFRNSLQITWSPEIVKAAIMIKPDILKVLKNSLMLFNQKNSWFC